MAKENGWEVSAEDWTLAELEDWVAGISRRGNIKELRGVASKTVKACPYLENPGDPEAYRTLKLKEWYEVTDKISAAFTAAFQK